MCRARIVGISYLAWLAAVVVTAVSWKLGVFARNVVSFAGEDTSTVLTWWLEDSGRLVITSVGFGSALFLLLSDAFHCTRWLRYLVAIGTPCFLLLMFLMLPVYLVEVLRGRGGFVTEKERFASAVHIADFEALKGISDLQKVLNAGKQDASSQRRKENASFADYLTDSVATASAKRGRQGELVIKLWTESRELSRMLQSTEPMDENFEQRAHQLITSVSRTRNELATVLSSGISLRKDSAPAK